MTIWMALRRIFARHFVYHLVIPLLGGVWAEFTRPVLCATLVKTRRPH